MSASPQLSLTERQARFELLSSKLVIQASIENIQLICFRFISTFDEDLKYFLEGKSQLDPRKGPTNHQKRLAKDFAVIKDGQFIWSRTPAYERMGAIAESIGLRWGGRWESLNDIYHVEYQEGGE